MLWYILSSLFLQIGTLEKFDPELDVVISSKDLPVIISEGYKWAGGPLWYKNSLLFSDVPNNVVYQWKPGQGTSVFLQPSGYSGEGTYGKEPGSNGLIAGLDSSLILCQHGNRQVARYSGKGFVTLASIFNGKRFSSPNDATIDKSGNVFFTDPPYGLPSQDDKDPLKEQPYNGVYRIDTKGKVHLLVDTLTRPNGIAFFPDGKKVLIANSDPKKPHWYQYEVKNGRFINGRIFATLYGPSPGLPDGLKINKEGYVFASGPGGINIFNSKGKLLGRLRLPEPASNCAFDPEEKTLYITNNSKVLKWTIRH